MKTYFRLHILPKASLSVSAEFVICVLQTVLKVWEFLELKDNVLYFSTRSY